jgi:hypothetical protein
VNALFRVLLAGAVAVFASASFAQAYDDREPRSRQAELDQILAPVALYPDSLLSQLLMAATYPRDVSEAAAWSRANPRLRGDEAVRAVENEPWDPSVKSLVAFPQVLAMMDERLEWTERLGEAFMSAPEQVSDTIQTLRGRADQAGNLRSSEELVVRRDYGAYVIEPAMPEVVHVPYYDPRVVYGSWWWPDYQPVWWSPWAGYRWTPGYSGFGWGYGVTLGSGFWFSSFDWPRRYIRFHGHRPHYYRGHSRWHGHRWHSDRDHRRNTRGWDGRRWHRDGDGRWNIRDGRDGRWDGRRDGRDGRWDGRRDDRDGRAGRRDGDGRWDGRRDGRDGRDGRREGDRVDRTPQGTTAGPGQGVAAPVNPIGRATAPAYREAVPAGEAQQRSYTPRVLPASPPGRGYGHPAPATSVAPSNPVERSPQRAHVPQTVPQVRHESRPAPAQPIAREPVERSEPRPERSESRGNDGGGRSANPVGRGGGRQRD